MASINSTPIGSHNRRRADVNGRVPRWGAAAKCARLHNVNVLTVYAGLKSGRFIVDDHGEIVTSGAAPSSEQLKRVSPPPDWRTVNPVPAHGAIKRACEKHTLTAATLYRRLRSGAFIVGPDREFVPANTQSAAKPARLAQPPLELRPMLPIDPIVGWHRAGWEKHINAWLEQAIELSLLRPADWALTRSDALKYLRGRLNALVEAAEQDAAANPPTPEREAERVAAAVRIGEKMKAGAL